MALAVTPEALRHSLELIEPQLRNFTPPGEPFDPAGSWSQAYQICTTHQVKPTVLCGQLKLQRAPQGDGAHLGVQQELRLAKRYATWAEASIECAADRWATPRRFAVETWVTAPDGTRDPSVQGKFSAEVVGDQIRYSGAHRSPVNVAADWTLDWTLLDALQRLPFRAGQGWQLDVVEDCDLLRPRQRLDCAGPLSVSLGGKTAELVAFCHTGTGTLPTQYWLDRQHRLLFVIHYYRVFILESGLGKQGQRK